MKRIKNFKFAVLLSGFSLLHKLLFAAPDAVTNLSALTGATEGRVVLNWTHPGPGTLPVGSTYFIQHSLNPNVVWSTASAQIRVSTSSVSAGMSQSYTVSSLTGGSTYYFRIWISSPTSEFSPVSNGATAWAQVDVNPPGQITGFAAVLGEQIRLTWIAPGDDNYTGNVSGGQWAIKYSTDSTLSFHYIITISTNFTQGTTQTYTLTGLIPTTTYYIQIRARDENAGNWSVWSATATSRASSFFISQTFSVLYDSTHGENAFGFSDIDTDEDIDLVTSGYDGANRWCIVYKNTAGNFSSWQNLSPGLQTSAICFSDINSDAKPDLVAIGSPDGSARKFIVYRNDSDSLFSIDSEPLGTDGFSAGGVAVLDFDNDGDNDIAVGGVGPGTSPNNRYLRIYENRNSSFTLHSELTGLSNCALAVGDYNNDGWTDLAAIGRDRSATTTRRFILFKNSSGSFTLDQEPLGTNVGLEFGSIAFFDYDLDGELDLAVCGTDGTNRRFILLKNNNGVFGLDQEPLGANIGVNNASLAFGDYNNDGGPDLVLTGRDNSGNNRFILFKNVSGTFVVNEEILGVNVGLQQSSVLFEDIDNDGDLDLVASGLPSIRVSNLIRIYKNATSDFAGLLNTPPQPPTRPSATYSDDRLIISFSDGSDALTPAQSLNYLVKVATIPLSINPSSYLISLQWASPFLGNYPKPKRTGTTNTISIKNLSIGVTYYFSVASIDSGLSKSIWSDEGSYYITDIYPPLTITSITALSGTNEGEIKLYWILPGDIPGNKRVSSYIIKFATYSVSDLSGDTTAWWNSATLVNNPPGPSEPGSLEIFTVTALFPSVTYYFSIKSIDSDGNISLIDLQTAAGNQRYSFATDISPIAPSGLTASSGDKTVILSWSDMSGEVGYMDFDFYEVFRSTESDNFFSYHITTSTVFTDTQVVNGVLYYYRIKAYDKPPMVLASEFSIIVSTMPVGVPVSPSNFSGIALSTYSIRWAWHDNSTDEESFIIRSPSGIIEQLPANSTYWIETGLNVNTNYERYVEAKNYVGVSSCASVDVYTLANPPEKLEVVSKTKNSVSLAWQHPVGGASRFRLERARNDLNFLVVSDNIDGSSSGYTDTNLIHSTTYYYRLFGYNGDGVITLPSETISVMTDMVVDTIPPYRPIGVSGVFVDGMFTIKWDDVRYNEDLSEITDLDGYFVYRSSAVDGEYVKLTPNPLKTNEFSDNTAGRLYFYKVTAVDIYSNESLPSTILSSKPLPTTIVLSENKDLIVETPIAIPKTQLLKLPRR